MAFLSKGGGTCAAFSFLESSSALELKLLLPGFHSQSFQNHQWTLIPEKIFHWTQCSIKILALAVHKTTGNRAFKPLQHRSFKMWVISTSGNWENYWILLQEQKITLVLRLSECKSSSFGLPRDRILATITSKQSGVHETKHRPEFGTLPCPVLSDVNEFSEWPIEIPELFPRIPTRQELSYVKIWEVLP